MSKGLRFQDAQMAELIDQMAATAARLEGMEERLINLGARLGLSPEELLERLEALVTLLEALGPVEIEAEPESLPELTFG